MGIALKMVFIGVLIFVIIILGIVLKMNGKPYKGFYFNLHKFASIGFVVLVFFFIKQFFKTTDFNFYLIGLIVIVCMSILGLFISGAFLSLDKMHETMQKLHKITTLFLLIFVSVLFYYFLK